MKNPGARLYPAILGALFLAGRAGLLRAEEPKPLNALRLPDVQASDSGASIPEPAAKAVVLPPVRLDRQDTIESLELDPHGNALRFSRARPFANLRLSPTYQSWLRFFENGTAAPEDIRDDWTMVGAVVFDEWSGGSLHGKSCKSLFGIATCLHSVVFTNPDGLQLGRLFEGQTLKFTDQTVSVSNVIDHRDCSYLKDSQSVSFHDPESYFSLFRTCRIFKNDESKLICKARHAYSDDELRLHHDAYWQGLTYFFVYSRDDGKDLLDPLPAIVKPFAAPAPTATLQKRRAKN